MCMQLFSVSLSVFAFLFSEVVTYSIDGRNWDNLESRLHEIGTRIGTKVLDLVCAREKGYKREIKILGILTFVSQICWKFLFGKTAELLKTHDTEGEYLLKDSNLLVNAFVAEENQRINCGAFVAGIVEGILCSSEFHAEVTAHSDGSEATTIIVRFFPEIVQREKIPQH
eukprot:GHVP01067469.1.p1 GENE.GHVP01067469.1~~GHVP01067469.1.p1  ORF type:complete len:170 (+),score=25.91 GHVP01067469.1:170-679(+)